MKKTNFYILAAIFFLLSACGYRNAYVASSNSKPISVNRSLWANNTGEIGLETIMYQSVSRWLRKSSLIHLVDDPNKADYKLTGKLVSVDFPEISYGRYRVATELRANLRVDIAIIDTATDKKIWKKNNYRFTETLDTSGDPMQLQANKKAALKKITNDIGEMIYLRFINNIMRPQEEQQSQK